MAAPYTHIFHFADLHIRDGNDVQSRYTEYATVFARAIDMIRDSLRTFEGQALCVVCGDVLHHKMRISSPGIKLWHAFVKGITDMMDLIVINGNHDMLQERREDAHNDMVEAMLITMRDPDVCSRAERVHYLSDTGTYRFGNVEFGVVAERDIVREGASSGRNADLPPFPTPSEEAEVRVALAHCTVKGCSMEGPFERHISPDGVPSSWFDGYDYALLGDVHAQQVKPRYAYPGSLVQQSFKEPLGPHGYLVWRVRRRALECVQRAHVPNPKGFLKAIVHDGRIAESGTKRLVVDDLLADPNVPESLHVRLYCKEDPHELPDLALLRERDAVVDVIRLVAPRASPEGDGHAAEGDEHASRCNHVETIRTFLSSTVGLSDPDVHMVLRPHAPPRHRDTPQAVEEDLAKRSDEVERKMQGWVALDRDAPVARTRRFRLVRASWDWILCYGKGNTFEFSRDTMSLLHAPNGFGKSAFFEIVVLGLFGTSVPSRKRSAVRNLVSVLNRKRPPGGAPSQITVDFELDGAPHTLVRIFREDTYADGRPRVKTKPTLYHSKALLRENARAVDAWVEEHLFCLDDFLMFNMITQSEDADFLRMSDRDQLERLDSVSQTDRYNRMCGALKELRTYCTHAANKMRSFLEGAQPTQPRPANVQPLRCAATAARSEWRRLLARATELRVDVKWVEGVIPTAEPPEEHVDELAESAAVLAQIVRRAAHHGIDRPLDYGDDAFSDLTVCARAVSRQDLMDERELRQAERELRQAERELRQADQEPRQADPGREPSRTRAQLLEALPSLEAARRGTDEADEADEAEIARLNAMLDDGAIALLDAVASVPVVSEGVDQALLAGWRETRSRRAGDHARWQTLRHRLIQLNAILDEPPRASTAKRRRELVNERVAVDAELGKLNVEFDTEAHDDMVTCLRFLERESPVGDSGVDPQRVLALRRARERVRRFEIKRDLRVAKEELAWWDAKAANDSRARAAALDDRVRAARAARALSTRAARANLQLDDVRRKLAYYARTTKRLADDAREAEERMRAAERAANDAEYLEGMWREFDDVVSVLEPQIKELDRRKDVVQSVVKSEGAYKAWVYNDNLLPVVCDHVNHVLRTVFSERDLRFHMSFEDDKLAMTAVDEGNRVFVEKLSGAQSFMVGLALRIGLRDMGVARYVCDQLFIDEGFCSFDQHNVAKIPVLFESLRRSYDEIVIVTHLDEIKHLVPDVVPIRRADGQSVLRRHC